MTLKLILNNSTPEGTKIDDMTSLLGLTQLINEPTNFEPNKDPSCIDLIITDQPNLILDSGTRSSLDPFCHHQIIYGKVNFRIPPAAIKRSMSSFPWLQHLSLNPDPNWQVKTLLIFC